MNISKAGHAVNRAVTAVFVIALFAFLLSFAISLPILNRWFYYIQIDTLNLEQASGHTYAEIKEAFDEIMDYLLLPGREFGEGVFPYSEEGAAHFMDCKPLFVLDVALAGASAGVLIIILALHFTKTIRLCSAKGHSAAFYTAIAAVVVPIVLGCLIALDFNRAFEIFHAILFPGKDNWLFNPRTDPIIYVLPTQFFMNCAIFIGVGLVVFSGAIIAGDGITMYRRGGAYAIRQKYIRPQPQIKRYKYKKYLNN